MRMRADEDLGINQGNLCVKGRFGWEYIHSPERLTAPMIRKNGSLVKASWEEALALITQRWKEIKAAKGGAALAGLCSPRLTNEELYSFQKFMRGVLETNHLDHAGGYSYAAHLALRDSLGYATSTSSINQIRKADVILLLRSDLSETHPVIKSEVVMAVKRRKAKLIVVNSRQIYLNKFSAFNLQVRPATEVTLINGMMQAILQQGLAKEEFVQSRTEGFSPWRQSLEKYAPEKVEALTGVPQAAFLAAARLFAQASAGVTIISSGAFSGKQDRALALAASDLALLTGHVGKENSGIFILGEKNNSQGALDMGVTPEWLPGYARCQDASERSRFESAWERPLPNQAGIGALAILQAAEEGKIQGLYVVGENLVVT